MWPFHGVIIPCFDLTMVWQHHNVTVSLWGGGDRLLTPHLIFLLLLLLLLHCMRGLEKNCTRWRKQTHRQTDRHTDMAAPRPTRPSGAELVKMTNQLGCLLNLLLCMCRIANKPGQEADRIGTDTSILLLLNLVIYAISARSEVQNLESIFLPFWSVQ